MWPDTPPAVAVTFAVPSPTDEVSTPVATPPLVTAEGEILPNVLVNATSVPSSTGWPRAFVTVAVMTAVLLPSATMADDEATSETAAGGPAKIETGPTLTGSVSSIETEDSVV